MLLESTLLIFGALFLARISFWSFFERRGQVYELSIDL